MARTSADPAATPPTMEQKELRFLRYMHEYELDCGMPPSRKEIKARFNCRDTESVLKVLKSLRVKGFIEIPSVAARAAKVTNKGCSHLAIHGLLREPEDA